MITKPKVTLTSHVTKLKIGETAVIQATFSDAPAKFTLSDFKSKAGQFSAFTQIDSTHYTALFTPTVSSKLTGPAISISAGIAANSVAAPALFMDMIAPTVLISSNAKTLKIGKSATITAKFSEVPVGFTIEDFQSSAGSFSNFKGNGSVYTATFTPTPSATAKNTTITIDSGSYSDNAGNLGNAAKSPNLSLDMIAPSVVITGNVSNLTAGKTTILTATFSEIPKGFTLADFKSTSGVFSNFKGSGSVYTVTFKATASLTDMTIPAGSYTDTAGNLGQAGILSFTLAPTTTIKTLTFSADTGISPSDFITNTATQAINGTLSAPLMEGEVVEISLDKGVSWNIAKTAGATFSLTDITLLGSNTLEVRVKNAIGSAGPTTLQDYALDTKAPSAVLTSDKTTMTQDETALIKVSFSEIPQNFNISDFNSTNGKLSDFTAGTDPKIYTVIFTPNDLLNEANADINLVKDSYTDLAGNVGNASIPPSLAISPARAYTIVNNTDGTQTETYNSTENGHRFISIYTYDSSNDKTKTLIKSSETQTWLDGLVSHQYQTIYSLVTNSDGTKTGIYTLNDDNFQTISKTFMVPESNNHTFYISNFNHGDSLEFSDQRIVPTVSNKSVSDNTVEVIYTQNNSTTRIHLTGISASQDLLLNNTPTYDTFLTVFA